MKIFKTQNVYFVFPLRMAPGMFTNLCLILLLLLAGSLQFQNFTFNYQKKAKKKFRKSSNIVQLVDGVTAVVLCSILS